MRPLYLLLRFLLPYFFGLFYRKSRTLNAQKKFNAQTIFVSNHPSAFIDPLVAGNFQIPVIYFVTRGDIFKFWLRPITWASHMVPIFRMAEDGADSHLKNKESFRYLRKVLLRKKSLILFGEGYTDDVFIRSLKPIKKGPARIGFDTMVESNWETDIKVQALGINYSHPKHLRSDVLLSFGQIIHLKDYKELYDENPNLAITKLTRDIQQSLQEQITNVERKDLAPFVENILILSRKGMNHFHHDASIPLEDKFRYSQQVANKINQEFDETAVEWSSLKQGMEDYFSKLKKAKINESWVYDFSKINSKNSFVIWLKFILIIPFILLGLIHQLIPYLIVKRFVEGTFKRDVFWSGVKLMVGATLSAVYNVIFIFFFYKFIYPSYGLALLYYLIVPSITGLIAYVQVKNLKNALAYRKVQSSELAKMLAIRKTLVDKLIEQKLM
jgi:glycerol-3-phosphate O-acyltransferase/dihydroxyacetone phosphate acyltransferase